MITQTLLKKLNALHNLYIFTFLFFLTFFCYANTLPNELFYDDEDFIYKNVYVQNFSVDKYFTENVIAGTGKVSNYYRPILLTTFGLEYKVFGSLPFIYHFTNLFLHGLAGILLFLLIKKLFNNTFIALCTSTLFLIHPIQTEAVSYASGRGDPLSTVFLLASLLFYLKRKLIFYFLSLCFLLFALLSKETVLIAPGLFLLITFFEKKKLKDIKKDFPFLSMIFFIVFGYFLLRLTSFNFHNTLNFYFGENIYTQNIIVRLLTYLSILPQYLSLLFFPKTLYIDRDVPIITTPLYQPILLSIFGICLFIFFSIKQYKKNPLLIFSFLWFFITFIPASGIIPINGIMYEHFLYLPSVGFFLIISFLSFQLLQSKKSYLSFSILVVLVVCLFLLSLRTIIRNADWHNPITFYKQTLTNNPKSARVHNNLAMAYAEKQATTQAIEEYKKAIALNDTYPQTHHNLGNIYVSLNKINDAEKEYKKAVEIDPSFAQGYIALYRLYTETGDEEKQKKLLKELEKNQNNKQLIQYLKSL